jgi:excisionase family DNA binding protein
MPRDESLTAATTPHSDRTATQLFELLTVADVAALLKVSKSWIYERTRDGAEDRLPAVKLGKYLRFDRNDLRAYVDAKRAASRGHRRRR